MRQTKPIQTFANEPASRGAKFVASLLSTAFFSVLLSVCVSLYLCGCFWSIGFSPSVVASEGLLSNLSQSNTRSAQELENVVIIVCMPGAHGQFYNRGLPYSGNEILVLPEGSSLDFLNLPDLQVDSGWKFMGWSIQERELTDTPIYEYRQQSLELSPISFLKRLPDYSQRYKATDFFYLSFPALPKGKAYQLSPVYWSVPEAPENFVFVSPAGLNPRDLPIAHSHSGIPATGERPSLSASCFASALLLLMFLFGWLSLRFYHRKFY